MSRDGLSPRLNPPVSKVLLVPKAAFPSEVVENCGSGSGRGVGTSAGVGEVKVVCFSYSSEKKANDLH